MPGQDHKSLAERLEELNDPAYAQQHAGIEEFLDSYYDLKRNIERIEAGNPSDTQGTILRINALEELKPKLREMEEKLHEMRGDSLEPSKQSIVPKNTPSQPTPPAHKNTQNTRNWDKYELRRLLDKIRMPGMTHQKLANEYGVSRQFISKQLKRADDVLGVTPKKATAFDALISSKRR